MNPLTIRQDLPSTIQMPSIWKISTGSCPMEYVCPRLVPRYSFCIDIALTDVRSGIQIKGRTKDVCLFGCSVDTLQPFAKGTMVRIRLSHEFVCVAAFGRVVHARKELGMGIAITNIDREDERILEDWIVELMAVRV